MVRRRLERVLEVVERGQQFLGELAHASVDRRRVLARHALAVVLEVRLRALGEREELGRVVLDRLLRLARLARGRGLGVAEGRLTGPRRAGVGRRGGGELVGVLLLGHHFCSSTTSASTTSSSASVEDGPAPLGSAVCAPAACSAWARSYIASETL